MKNLVILALLPMGLLGQRTMTQTTLTKAVGVNDGVIYFASTAGMSPATIRQSASLLLIEQEAMTVTGVGALAASVSRGSRGMLQSAHLVGTVVWVGAPADFAATDPQGACVSTQQRVLPRVVLSTGTVWDCTGGNWVSRTAGGSGNMTSSTYDPAAKASQVEVVASKDVDGGYVGRALDGSSSIPGGLATGSGPLLITGLHGGTADCGTVPSNKGCLFLDSTNSDHVSRKDHAGTVFDLEATGGGGQTLSTGSVIQPMFEWASWNSAAGSSTAVNKTVALYRRSNPFASRTIKAVAVSGYSGTGKAVMGVFDASCALIQESPTVTMAGGSAANIFTFASAAVVTGPYYYVAWAAEDTTAYSISQDAAGQTHPLLDALTGYIAATGANPATQPGGSGTTMHMPASCGALTRVTGADGMPPLWIMSTN